MTDPRNPPSCSMAPDAITARRPAASLIRDMVEREARKRAPGDSTDSTTCNMEKIQSYE